MVPLTIAYKDSENIKLLDSFKDLQENWNGYGAKAFDEMFIDHVIKIVSALECSPKIFPTGRNSIQLEYEKDNGDYFEFEIYESGHINCLRLTGKLENEEAVEASQINPLIREFHAE